MSAAESLLQCVCIRSVVDMRLDEDSGWLSVWHPGTHGLSDSRSPGILIQARPNDRSDIDTDEDTDIDTDTETCLKETEA